MEFRNDGIKVVSSGGSVIASLKRFVILLISFVCVGMAGVENSVAARVREALHGANDETLDRMQTLEQERRALNVERKRIARELKNESQKRRRLLQKARNLSIDDLLQVAMTRSAAKAKATAKAKAAVRS